MRWQQLLGVLLASVWIGGCAHGLAECDACGTGFLCQEESSSITCLKKCSRDAQCGEHAHCNCESETCTYHTPLVPPNVCLAPDTRIKDEFYDKFAPSPKDNRFCNDCPAGQVCFDIGHGEKPVFRCAVQCATDKQCRPPEVCNCADKDCSVDDALMMRNICVVTVPAPPAPAAP
jgi:hypothetical protein